jgi:sugar O-acyltransferase (sialic acid O-acetyltransferase NeuD family)
MKKDIIVIGGGGHAKVLIDTLQMTNMNVIGILDANPAATGQKVLGVPVLGTDENIQHYSPDKVMLVNGLGSIDIPLVRKNIFYQFKAKGFEFYSVIHPSTFISRHVKWGEGCQIMAGSIIQAGTILGDNVIINSGATVDHDCQIGNHTHLAPGTVLSGNLRIEEECHVGAHAIILQGLHIARKSLVGAGAVVIRSLVSGSRVAGVPAKEIQSIREELLDEELE